MAELITSTPEVQATERVLRQEIDDLLVAMDGATSVEEVDNIQRRIDEKILGLKALLNGSYAASVNSEHLATPTDLRPH